MSESKRRTTELQTTLNADIRATTRATIDEAISIAYPPRIRTMRKFAEDEIRIPEGKYAGRRFNVYRQPWAGLLLDEIDSGKWSRIFITGCVQSGKTLVGTNIPVCYHLFERKETVIFAAPTMETTKDKWLQELLPMIRANPKFEAYLPTEGKSSRLGWSESITFKHGVTLKFMSARGSDVKRSGFTARVVVATELDKMDEAATTSRESDPVSQFEARTASFGESARIYGECTVSLDYGRIWSEYTKGSASKLMCPCPHCTTWVCPERTHFVGFDGADNEIEAEENSAFICPECGAIISEDERRKMNLGMVCVHKGQKPIGNNGELKIDGELPKTRTLGFRWNAFNNMFWPTTMLGRMHFRASDSDEEQNSERFVSQFVWATPYVPPSVDTSRLDPFKVRRRTDKLPVGLVPDDTEYFTLAIDPGKWTAWWLALCFRANGCLHIPAYGAFDVVTNKADDVEIRLLNALRWFRDEVIEVGWATQKGSQRVPDQVWIDSGYLETVVFAFVKESGELRKNRYRPILGRGQSQLVKHQYTHPPKITQAIREVGEQMHTKLRRSAWIFQTTINADYWKRYVHERLSTEQGTRGSLEFYAGDKHEHKKLSRHLTNEQLRREWEPGKGYVEYWDKRGDNHWLDTTAYACAAGSYLGFTVSERDTKTVRDASDWFENMERKKQWDI